MVDIFNGDQHFTQLIKERDNLCRPYGITFDPYTEQPTVSNLDDLKVLLKNDWDTYQKLQAQITPYAQHVRDIMISNTALEILAPVIAKEIFGDDLIVPENTFFIDETGMPCTASKSVGDLDEFLTHHELVKNKKTPKDWDQNTKPTVEELLIIPGESEEESIRKAELLGEAFAVALLMGHLDLVNNINLSNFGSVTDPVTGEKKLCIVDWGNCLGAGFGGLTSDESTFHNPDFDRNQMPQNPITGFQDVVPFDTEVVPRVPRQIVSDLFALGSTDNPKLRQAQLAGFDRVCRKMEAQFSHMETLVSHAIEETIMHVPKVVEIGDENVNQDNRNQFVSALPRTAQPAHQEEVGSLTNILKGRAQSLVKIRTELQAGKSLDEIAKNRLERIKASQNIGIFKTAKVRNIILKTKDIMAAKSDEEVTKKPERRR